LAIFSNPVTVIGATGTIAGVMAMHPMHTPWLQSACQVWCTAAPMLLAHSWLQHEGHEVREGLATPDGGDTKNTNANGDRRQSADATTT